MSKAKKGSKENPISGDDLKSIFNGVTGNQRSFKIVEASIKDDFCNYTYEVTKGVGLGDKHKVDGKGIVMDDMLTAFASFNVHLACIDDVFLHSKTEFDDIDTMNNHEFTFLYLVTGFKILGGEDNESIILSGNKYVSSAGGRIEIKSPKIPLDNLSSYKWYNELKTAANKARREVEEYKEGKYEAVLEDPEEEKKSSYQLTIGESDETLVDDFESAKI